MCVADKPKIKAGIDLVPRLKRKEGEGLPGQVRISDCAQSNVHTNLKSGPLDPCLPGQAATVESDEEARLKRLADAKEREAKRAEEKQRKAEAEAEEAERRKQAKKNKKKKKKKKTVDDVVHNKEL